MCEICEICVHEGCRILKNKKNDPEICKILFSCVFLNK